LRIIKMKIILNLKSQKHFLSMIILAAILFSLKMANLKELPPKILNKNFIMLEFLFIWVLEFK
jgi:hypothetical protein